VLSLYSARMVTVDSGKEFSVEARDAFDDVADISAVPDTVHTNLRRPSPGADSRADRSLSEARRRGGAFPMGTAENHSLCKLALEISRLLSLRASPPGRR
jgi:hypothetical protein